MRTCDVSLYGFNCRIAGVCVWGRIPWASKTRGKRRGQGRHYNSPEVIKFKVHHPQMLEPERNQACHGSPIRSIIPYWSVCWGWNTSCPVSGPRSSWRRVFPGGWTPWWSSAGSAGFQSNWRGTTKTSIRHWETTRVTREQYILRNYQSN